MLVLGWIVVVIMAAIAVLILTGKGGCFIAGFNTASKKQKENYNVKLLNYICGIGLVVLTIIAAAGLALHGEFPASLHWLMPWGYLCLVFVVLVLSNTVCRKDVMTVILGSGKNNTRPHTGKISFEDIDMTANEADSSKNDQSSENNTPEA